MKPFIIAIDGSAASGKGTLARSLAEKLGLAFLDTGKLYRYVGYRLLKEKKNPDNEEEAVRLAQSLGGRLKPDDLQDPVLQSDEAGQAGSKVARFAGVRQALYDFQRGFALNPPDGGAVLDGRDIGTVICPDADIKFFITAPAEIRASRRLKELQSKGISVTYDAVLADMRERDARDAGRDAAPMIPAQDAIIMDTGAMSAAEVLDEALAHLRAKFGDKLFRND